jgi:hypothetical protein
MPLNGLCIAQRLEGMSQRVDSSVPAEAPHPIHLCGEEISHAGHICAFFDSSAEKYRILAPYFAEGIADGDRIINVVDAGAREEHLRTLRRADVPVAESIDSGQFELLTAEETYLKAGAASLDGMLDLLQEALKTAQRDGVLVRTCGEMNWVGRSNMPTEVVMAYEARVNDFVPTFQCTLLCVYDLAQMRSGMVADILATHPTAVINGQLRPNPYFVEPAAFLQMLRQRSAARAPD